MNNVTILGGGVLGTQIAFQCAYTGKNVTIWLRSEDSKTRTIPKLENLKETYIKEINLMSENGYELPGLKISDKFDKDKSLSRVNEAFSNIKIELDLKNSLEGADLVIESMSENIEAKKDVYTKINKLLSKNTIVVSNSSTMLPSKLVKYLDNKENFLALHFANSIWKNNTAEVMKQKYTSDESFEKVINFAKSINMITLSLYKEKSGYLLNSMLIPFLFSALDLLAKEISDVESIDLAWKKGTGSPKGPFEILDIIGLKTAYEIVSMYLKVPSFLAPYNFKAIAKLLQKYIDEGKLGKSTKEGFYKYD